MLLFTLVYRLLVVRSASFFTVYCDAVTLRPASDEPARDYRARMWHEGIAHCRTLSGWRSLNDEPADAAYKQSSLNARRDPSLQWKDSLDDATFCEKAFLGRVLGKGTSNSTHPRRLLESNAANDSRPSFCLLWPLDVLHFESVVDVCHCDVVAELVRCLPFYSPHVSAAGDDLPLPDGTLAALREEVILRPEKEVGNKWATDPVVPRLWLLGQGLAPHLADVDHVVCVVEVYLLGGFPRTPRWTCSSSSPPPLSGMGSLPVPLRIGGLRFRE